MNERRIEHKDSVTCPFCHVRRELSTIPCCSARYIRISQSTRRQGRHNGHMSLCRDHWHPRELQRINQRAASREQASFLKAQNEGLKRETAKRMLAAKQELPTRLKKYISE